MADTMTLTTGWEPTAPLEDSVLRQFVFAYADRVAWMAGAAGQVDRDPDACIADVRSGFGYDNAAVLLRPPGDIDITEVLHRARTLLPPERWWILLSAWALPDLSAHGLALVGHPPLMVRLPGTPIAAPPSGLEVIEVHDHRTMRDFEAVLSDGFPLPAGGAVADTRLLGDRLHLYVGYLDGEPAGTAGASVANGIVEVDWVATMPACRRRGVGAAMTVAAASTDPTLPALLLASDQGHSLYQRLGFFDLLRLTIWEHRAVTAASTAPLTGVHEPTNRGDGNARS
jgi:ribosomal protein S18 acetylase RimI-like enzyme